MVSVLGLAAVVFILLVLTPPARLEEPPAEFALSFSATLPKKSLRLASRSNLGRAVSLRGPTPFSSPLTFEPNVGQTDPRVLFVGRGKGITALLTRKGIEVAVPDQLDSQSGAHIVRVSLKEGREFNWEGKQQLRGETNYFIGNDPRKWHAHIPHFARAQATNVIPGAGIVIYGNEEGVEFDLRLRPGVEIEKLRLEISGAGAPRLDRDGDLTLPAGGTEIRLRDPQAFEELPHAKRRRVNGAYALHPDGTVGFRVGPYDPGASLVIDPSLSVAYSTFLGGTGEDQASSIALDSSGKLYIGGTTTSATTFPEPGAKLLGPNGGSSDLFVAKIDPAAGGANSLVYPSWAGVAPRPADS